MPKDEVSNKKRTEVKTKKDLKKEWETEGKGLGYDTPEEYFNDFYGPLYMKKGGMPKVKKYRSGKMVTEDGYEQLLPPGEDPGEGYKGSPDMYPDYEEDRKEAEALKNKDRNRNSSGKTKSMAYGGSVMVKTKLGRNKPTKIC
jgi:hypothetical protein